MTILTLRWRKRDSGERVRRGATKAGEELRGAAGGEEADLGGWVVRAEMRAQPIQWREDLALWRGVESWEEDNKGWQGSCRLLRTHFFLAGNEGLSSSTLRSSVKSNFPGTPGGARRTSWTTWGTLASRFTPLPRTATMKDQSLNQNQNPLLVAFPVFGRGATLLCWRRWRRRRS